MDIGQGGTGKTVLLKDELIDECFVCKKYSPYDEQYKDMFYKNFVEEIKILYKIYHKNIVRVFSYHLYPEQKTGYILMEFIEGKDIKTFLKYCPNKINEIFEQTMDGFCYLEQIGILHRDIRPQNILVSNEGFVKIIDFGFGKKINFDDDFEKSISLNWPYTIPNDFKNGIYDFRTEEYFIGKLFEEVIIENHIESFLYADILSKMTSIDYRNRIDSFVTINKMILSGEIESFAFSEEDKTVYRTFAYQITSIFSEIESGSTYITDTDLIILELNRVYKDSVLEDYIQDSSSITSCFLKGPYRFHPSSNVPVLDVKDFLKLFKTATLDKQQIILNNLWRRLDTIKRYQIADLPF